jgi:hypothetical protein
LAHYVLNTFEVDSEIGMHMGKITNILLKVFGVLIGSLRRL